MIDNSGAHFSPCKGPMNLPRPNGINSALPWYGVNKLFRQQSVRFLKKEIKRSSYHVRIRANYIYGSVRNVDFFECPSVPVTQILMEICNKTEEDTVVSNILQNEIVRSLHLFRLPNNSYFCLG